MRLELTEVIEVALNYRAGQLARSALEAALATRILTPIPRDAPDVEPSTESQALAYTIAEHICSTGGPDEDLDLFLRRVLACVEQVPDPAAALDLIPLIAHHDEFSVLVLKHVRGLISRAGIKSVIAKRLRFDTHADWLAGAPADRLLAVTALVEADDYRGLQNLLASQ